MRGFIEGFRGPEFISRYSYFLGCGGACAVMRRLLELPSPDGVDEQLTRQPMKRINSISCVGHESDI